MCNLPRFVLIRRRPRRQLLNMAFPQCFSKKPTCHAGNPHVPCDQILIYFFLTVDTQVCVCESEQWTYTDSGHTPLTVDTQQLASREKALTAC